MKIYSKPQFLRLFRRNSLPAIVFLGALLLTLGGWQYALYLDRSQAEQQFKKLAQDYQQDLNDRFKTYLQVLVDLRGLFDSSQYISRTEFDGFMHSINLMQNFPGIRRIGYAPLVGDHEIPTFEARAQMEGFANYRIKSTQQATSYFPILYAYPINSRVEADILGLNLAGLPNRATAMAFARDANRLVVTRKIAMPSDLQHNPAIGFYLPVYRHGAPLQTLIERRQALSGFVFEGFRVEDLLRGVFGKGFINTIDLKIYDGTREAPATLLYQTSGRGTTAHRPDILSAKYIASVKVANNTWTLVFSSKPGFFKANRTSTPTVVLFSGLLTTLLLTGIAVLVNMRRRLAWSKEEQNQRFRSLFEQNPDAVYAFDRLGNFVDANEETARLAGLPRGVLLKKSFRDIIAPEGRGAAALRFDQARKGIPQSGETEILTPTGNRLTLNVSMLPIVVNGKITGVFGIAKDITEKKRVEEALRESEARLRGIFEQAPMGIMQLSLNNQLLRANQKFLDIVGYSFEELRAQKVVHLVTHPEDLQRSLVYEEMIRSGETDTYSMEKRYVRKDGSTIWVSLTKTAVKTADGNLQFLIAIIEDITGRKRTEAALQRAHDELEDKVRARTEELNNAYQTLKDLSSHLHMAREEERTRIAREVHDEMGGVLTAIKIDISMLKQQLEAQGRPAPGELSRTLELIDGAVTSLRRIITDLRPSILDTMGLWAAIEWQLQEFQQRTDITCSFQMEGIEKELGDDRATAVFRIFQEALTNVARHARASKLDVFGFASEDEVVIHIQDNGIGIREERLMASRSFGILGMHERARTFNGYVQIKGAPAKGTTVSIRFPLKGPSS